MTWPTEAAREAVLRTLADHGMTQNGEGDPHSWRCAHPDRYPGFCTCIPDLTDDLLSALAVHVAQERAAALTEAADDLPAYTEGEGREGIRTWKQPAQDAYSIAIEEAQSVLRERADREAGR